MDYGMQANRKTHRKQPKIPYSKTKKKNQQKQPLESRLLQY